MVEVDGYKAFRGTLHVIPTEPGYAPYELTGDCLYKPETNCWYVKPDDGGWTKSVPANICEVCYETNL